MKWLLMMLVAGVLILPSLASSAATRRPAYVTEDWISTRFEGKGLYYGYRHWNIDTASCLGLRRYGARTSDYGLDRFWRFKCDVITSSERFGTAWVRTTGDASYIYWHVDRLRFQ
jgi:hypothetical protein